MRHAPALRPHAICTVWAVLLCSRAGEAAGLSGGLGALIAAGGYAEEAGRLAREALAHYEAAEEAADKGLGGTQARQKVRHMLIRAILVASYL